MERKSIVFTGKNQVEWLTEETEKPAAGQLLIETRKSLISTGTECICLARNFAPGTHWDSWVQYPFRTGYSNVGRVLEVGEGVEGFVVGDRVASRSNHSQFVLAKAAESFRVPDGVSDEDATWFGLATIVQIGVRRAEHRLGDAVVLVGMGLLGQLATQYVRLCGAREIIVVDTAQPRLEMATAHGATLALSKSVSEVSDEVMSATQGRGADVVYDITGHPAVFGPAMGLARRFGKLLLLGDAGTPGEQRLTSDVIMRGVRIVGAHDGHPPASADDHNLWSKKEMGELFFNYIARGQMRVSDLVTHRYAPTDASAAYQMLLTDRSAAMGVVFDWTK